MRAEKSLVKVSRDYEKYIRNMNEIKNSMDRASREERIREKGHAEGKIEGLEIGRFELYEEKLQIARNLLAEGSTPEFVQKITGLDLETIEKL